MEPSPPFQLCVSFFKFLQRNTDFLISTLNSPPLLQEQLRLVFVSGPISTAVSQVKVGSNKSIIGSNSSVVFTGFGLLVKSASNVIIRNIAIKKVLAANGDAIGV